MNQNTRSHPFNNRSTLVVCIVCALEKEAQAFLHMAEEHYHLAWISQISNHYKYSYRLSTLANEDEEPVAIHLSWLPRYGPNEMLLHLSHVIEENQPCFTIMTGICAGDRQHVRLGDLIVAERVFSYDTGKMVKGEQEQTVHRHDTLTYQLHENTLQFLHSFRHWEQLAATFSRPASKRQQRDWLLERLLREQTASIKAIPRAELEEYVPAWRELVQELQQGAQPFLSPAPALALLDKAMVEALDYGLEPFPFRDPPAPRCHIRPLASGRAVRSDNPFKDIQIPVRGAVAIDMEGDGFARVMETERFLGIEWLIVKGVSDYADQDKDDSYHIYASNAAAVYALCFIKAYVTQERFPLANEGLLSLEKGKKALGDGLYPPAKKELRKAVEEIDRENQPVAASKARYFLALALLEGNLPRTQGTDRMQTIERLMNEAISICPCASYYRIFARIKWDFFEFNGAKYRFNEVLALDREGAAYARCADDEEHEQFFRRCQPRLQL